MTPPCGVPSHAGPTGRPPLALALAASVRCREPSTVPGRVSSPPVSADLAGCCRRKPPHTTHHRDFPERVTITRPHHPFEGQSLEVLRHAHMRGRLQFVLILPDGSKSLIPAEWTDFKTATGPSPDFPLVGSLEDLLRLRSLVDALLRRSPDVPLTSGPDQESHAATEPELHRHPHPGDAPVRATRRRAKTDRRRDSGAPHDQCKPHRPTPGADQ